MQDPVLIHLPCTENFREIDADLLVRHEPTTIPEGDVPYSQGLQLWAIDRGLIQTLNGQLLGISSLGSGGLDSSESKPERNPDNARTENE